MEHHHISVPLLFATETTPTQRCSTTVQFRRELVEDDAGLRTETGHINERSRGRRNTGSSSGECLPRLLVGLDDYGVIGFKRGLYQRSGFAMYFFCMF